MEMKYYIDGEVINAKTEIGAMRIMKKVKGSFLSFYRRPDGQFGYINQDGNCEITGQKWNWNN